MLQPVYLYMCLIISLVMTSSAPAAGEIKAIAHPSLSDTTQRWHGYDYLEFTFDGVSAKIAFPLNPAKERPWIWRTQFWDHQPQTDLALLARGFFVVYVDLVDLYGSPVAVSRANRFYDFLVRNFALNPKVTLEGFSRGGLDALNWAIANPTKVACLYLDAPVCDIKSWPGGLGQGQGSREDWRKCLRIYGLDSSSVLTFQGTTVHQAGILAKAQIPILSVCGDADDIVPLVENTYALANKMREAGGDIQIIIKKGVGHHPHSLADPQPIVDFILTHTLLKEKK